MAKKFGALFRRHLILLVFVLALSPLGGVLTPDPAKAASSIKKASVQKKPQSSAKKSSAQKNSTQKSEAKKKSAKSQVPKKKAQAGVKKNPKKAKVAKLDPEKLPFPDNVKTLAGSGAVLLIDHHVGQDLSRELFALNPDKAFVPASILKLVTAGAALDALGFGYRFRTEFYLDPGRNLWIVGRGDPFLVAEELCLLMESLRQTGLSQVKDVYLDNSFFESGLILDGNTFTNNPYDAYNLALGVNFNTVNYLIDQKGKIVECDPCSPITEVTKEVASRNPLKKRRKNRYPQEFRLNISSSPLDAEKNTGQMFQALLTKYGVTVSGDVVLGRTLPKNAKLIYAHLSSKTLEELIKELLKHSNNFMTNQIFLTMGAEKFGAPATPEKSHQVVIDFLAKYDLPSITMVEGSGLSRRNSLTARQMSRILGTLEPVRHLINSNVDGSVIAKTGTMSDIQTLAGYLVRPERLEEPLSFVILLNGPYKTGTRDKILKALKAHFIGEETKPIPQNAAENSQKSAADSQKSAGKRPKDAGLFAPPSSTL
ncbi:MAG: D-alanyl-D-alanine carboxypeptidase [Deltaproteobacteria bacterium]|jgi:D-alanyl-D-alanine carboxypeptidase/D-alanyl-D-alanine-endopeptidase (penicillin-binding protein 4)|nr:D-alanyl-D-alanine carboxypeptidase [Deltaproteobacteria bacterium]